VERQAGNQFGFAAGRWRAVHSSGLESVGAGDGPAGLVWSKNQTARRCCRFLRRKPRGSGALAAGADAELRIPAPLFLTGLEGERALWQSSGSI